MSCLTKEKLKEILLYDEECGQFYRRGKIRKGLHVGEVAGSTTSTGYWRITIEKKEYLAHRLAWLYMKGEWPEKDIDHINGNPQDNRWSNLRLCSKRESNLNRGVLSNSRTGVKGVKLLVSGRFQVLVDNKSYGTYPDLELAEMVAQEVRNKVHGEFARHG